MILLFVFFAYFFFCFLDTILGGVFYIGSDKRLVRILIFFGLCIWRMNIFHNNDNNMNNIIKRLKFNICIWLNNEYINLIELNNNK